MKRLHSPFLLLSESLYGMKQYKWGFIQEGENCFKTCTGQESSLKCNTALAWWKKIEDCVALPIQSMQRAGEIKIKFHPGSHQNWPCLSLKHFSTENVNRWSFGSHSFLPREELLCFSPPLASKFKWSNVILNQTLPRFCTPKFTIGSLFP